MSELYSLLLSKSYIYLFCHPSFCLSIRVAAHPSINLSMIHLFIHTASDSSDIHPSIVFVPMYKPFHSFMNSLAFLV